VLCRDLLSICGPYDYTPDQAYLVEGGCRTAQKRMIRRVRLIDLKYRYLYNICVSKNIYTIKREKVLPQDKTVAD